MENQEIMIDFSTISPFLRFIHQDIYINNEYHVPWRILYDYELIYVYEGTLYVETETEQYTVSEGEVHIMPPFVHHRRFNKDSATIRLYSLHFDMFYQGKNNDFSADEYIKPCDQNLKTVAPNKSLIMRPYHSLKDVTLPRKMTVLNPVRFLSILNSTLEAYNQKAYGYELDMKAGILQLLRLIIADYYTLYTKVNSTENGNKISWCIEFIHSNYNKEIDFIELAGQKKMSYSHFRRLFKLSTGKSPNEYLISIRIEKSIELLRKGIYPISEICEMVGYDDIHYFSKLFKDKTGYPPSLFLKHESSSIY